MKFKVGDKVKFVEDCRHHEGRSKYIKIGDVLHVCAVDWFDPDLQYRCVGNSTEDYWWFGEGELELIGEKEPVKTYEDGMNDLRMALLKYGRDISHDNRVEMFGKAAGEMIFTLLDNFEPAEIIKKVREFEAAEIKVGDEVTITTSVCDDKYVVLVNYHNGDYMLLAASGKTKIVPKARLTKTGRHYDNVKSMMNSLEG